MLTHPSLANPTIVVLTDRTDLDDQLFGNLSSSWADTFVEDRHPDIKADFILANPPFNMSDWPRNTHDQRWKYGTPPAGNANFAWLQHIVWKLGSRSSAGVVLTNGSMSSNSHRG